MNSMDHHSNFMATHYDPKWSPFMAYTTVVIWLCSQFCGWQWVVSKFAAFKIWVARGFHSFQAMIGQIWGSHCFECRKFRPAVAGKPTLQHKLCPTTVYIGGWRIELHMHVWNLRHFSLNAANFPPQRQSCEAKERARREIWTIALSAVDCILGPKGSNVFEI